MDVVGMQASCGDALVISSGPSQCHTSGLINPSQEPNQLPVASMEPTACNANNKILAIGENTPEGRCGQEHTYLGVPVAHRASPENFYSI